MRAMDIEIINSDKKEVGRRELNSSLFQAKVRGDLLHTCVVAHLASIRRGTHSVKDRSMIRGSGRKLWKQKGTGNARVGAGKKSPLWRGGGVIFGPTPRDYTQKVNKKVKRTALMSALSVKASTGSIVLLDKLELDAVSTKSLVSLLRNIGIERKALIVVEKEDKNLSLSARNIPWAKVQRIESLNVYDIMNHNDIVFTTSSLEKVEERFAL